MRANLSYEKKKTRKHFDLLYWGCVRPICIAFYAQLLKELLSYRQSSFFDEFITQYRRIIKNKNFRITRSVHVLLNKKILLHFKKHKKQYALNGYKITFTDKSIYIRHDNSPLSIFCISLKKQIATGLTELFTTNNRFVQQITFTNPSIEFITSLYCMMHKPCIYTIKDIIYEFDSIYMHELQHICDDVSFMHHGLSRADDRYVSLLKSNSSRAFNNYLHHPVEIAANIQQLAYYLHYLKPRGTIDALRFYKFFQKYKPSKYDTSFRHSELSKFHVLFNNKTKKHTPKWYNFLFRLLNFKYYQLYKRPILTNIKMCVDKISI